MQLLFNHIVWWFNYSCMYKSLEISRLNLVFFN